ncbi:MAG: 3-dehydroquinate synthase [Actinomycetes bacterium]
MSQHTRITVRGDSPYDVVVGQGLRGELAGAVGAGVSRVAVIHSDGRTDDGNSVVQQLRENGFEVLALAVPDAEAAKTAQVAEQCWAGLGKAGFTRGDVVVGVGGGTTTDLAGFVAATWLRGVRLVQVPTTLLGMVDAAVGGKTGINTAEGKNLVGSFHPPSAVLCDLDFLASLPRIDLAAGLAEVVKVGFTSDPIILDLVEAGPLRATDPFGPILRELIERAITVKADVVSGDLRENRTGGLGREVLNYGHTFAHAIEQVERYSWRHGHAVAVGLVYVSTLARLAGRLSGSDAQRHRSILESLDLPVSYAAGRFPELLDAMRIDKKTRGDLLRFIVLDGIGVPGLLEGPDQRMLEAAYDEISQEPS